ncbi:DUF1428 domain-containing protein [Pseudoxanthomonas sp. SL93]|uniref:DUF1428 domain-containing protein n=1 Tax=Pseudoxanthomonas sp. SL93 TaxID=2995142 RepID=UPI00226D6183|nr:DUF1428 domain-containing protein [Pseudoxanthomonas sp. SL93]WAC63702.1 DUF1428 domain-containing protein [Pseudoxanthomonas sp. SL93]
MYVDGFVAAVPASNLDAYRKLAVEAASIYREHGALSVIECWGDDVPEGEVNSFHTAVKREPGEVVVFAWISWPSKAARDEGNKKVMADPRMDRGDERPPFDARRMIYGGFSVLVNA